MFHRNIFFRWNICLFTRSYRKEISNRVYSNSWDINQVKLSLTIIFPGIVIHLYLPCF